MQFDNLKLTLFAYLNYSLAIINGFSSKGGSMDILESIFIY